MNLHTTKLKSWLILFFKGTLMGVADLIPGVSGGTLALILGAHQELMFSLKSIGVRALRNPKRVSWFFLSALFLGILVALALGAGFISKMLNHPQGFLFLHALFFGLVLGSLFFCGSKVHSWNFRKVILAALGALVALSFIFLSPSQKTEFSYSAKKASPEPSISNVNFYLQDLENDLWIDQSSSRLKNQANQKKIDPNTWIYPKKTHQRILANSSEEFMPTFRIDYRLILCGIISICAMLLPGISGSQVMVIFGYYHSVIHAIAIGVPLFLKGQIMNDSFWILAQLAFGILIGLALFSRFASYLYEKYPQSFLSVLIGFMAGSLPSVWPFWKTHLVLQTSTNGLCWKLQKLNPLFPSFNELETWLAFCLMFLAIVLLLWMKQIEKKRLSIIS